MQAKSILLSLAAAAICGSVYAQDKIVKRDGNVIDAKIKSVGTKTITYTRHNDNSGPEYTVVKADVSKITYENGTEDTFDDDWRSRRPGMRGRTGASPEGQPDQKSVYGPNVVALAPLQFSDNGLGFSVSYERSLDQAGIVSFYMPLILTWDLNNRPYYDPVTGMQRNGHQDMMFYAMPGIKLYPTGAFGKVRYSVGPSIVIATGQRSTSSNYSPYPAEITQSQMMLGMVINNSLNINPSSRVYMGLELGMGFTYLNRIEGLNESTSFLAQGGFKVGYRF